jgi:signal transduction histidine kinase
LLKDEGSVRTQSELQIINGIIDEGERIARIVRDLLTFARQDEHQPRQVDVVETIRNSLSLFGRQLEKEGIRVEVEAEEGLPAVMADGLRLRQVIVNMISNARHALAAKPSEQKLFRISAKAVDCGGKEFVQLEFFDNGIGIPPENLDKVFDPFFTTRRDKGGTGLGLSLSFGIIRSYGGVITVESRQGEYTRFVARLPAAMVTKYASGAAC